MLAFYPRARGPFAGIFQKSHVFRLSISTKLAEYGIVHFALLIGSTWLLIVRVAPA